MTRDQTCSACGLTEAAGSYCTRCLARTQPDWLHKSTRGNRSGVPARRKPEVDQETTTGRTPPPRGKESSRTTFWEMT